MEAINSSTKPKNYTPYDETEEYMDFYNKVRSNISKALKKAKTTRKTCAEEIGINYSEFRELSATTSASHESFTKKRKKPKHSAFVILRVAEITGTEPNELLGYVNNGLGPLSESEKKLIKRLRSVDIPILRERLTDKIIVYINDQIAKQQKTLK